MIGWDDTEPDEAADVADLLGPLFDELDAEHARPLGMKPPTFAWWMFELVGARPGDTFVDLFPGSGAVSRAWERFTTAADDASPRSQLHVAQDLADASCGDRHATDRQVAS